MHLVFVFAFLVFALMFVGWNKKAGEKRKGEERDYHPTTLNKQTFHISQYIRLRLSIDLKKVGER